MHSSAHSRVTGSHESSSSLALQPAFKRKTIAVIGSINMDYILRVPRFPHKSETLLATCDRMPGGKGAMQALACFKLLRMDPGARRRNSRVDNSDNVDIVIELHARVGADRLGREVDQAGKDVLNELRDIGLTTSYIQVVPGAETGRAFVTVCAETGENYVLLAVGANRAIDAPIPFPQHHVDLCIFELEIEPELVWSHIRTARDRGAEVLLNAAPATEHIPDDIWHNLNHLHVNKPEADALVKAYCDRNIVIEDTRDMSRSELVARYQHFCKLFLDKRVQNVVITLGEHGCVAGSMMEDGEDLIIDQEVARVENIVDQTGAGGVFVGAYAIDYVRQTAGGRTFDIKHAVEWACRAARLSVQRAGSIDGIPTGDMVV